jgi:hypothetical protein
MTHLWSPWRGSCTRQGGQHTVEARSQADPLGHCAALCRPCCTTAAACPHHRRHCPHAGAGYLDARQRAKLTRSVVNSARSKKTCVRRLSGGGGVAITITRPRRRAAAGEIWASRACRGRQLPEQLRLAYAYFDASGLPWHTQWRGAGVAARGASRAWPQRCSRRGRRRRRRLLQPPRALSLSCGRRAWCSTFRWPAPTLHACSAVPIASASRFARTSRRTRPSSSPGCRCVCTSRAGWAVNHSPYPLRPEVDAAASRCPHWRRPSSMQVQNPPCFGANARADGVTHG